MGQQEHKFTMSVLLQKDSNCCGFSEDSGKFQSKLGSIGLKEGSTSKAPEQGFDWSRLSAWGFLGAEIEFDNQYQE